MIKNTHLKHSFGFSGSVSVFSNTQESILTHGCFCWIILTAHVLCFKEKDRENKWRIYIYKRTFFPCVTPMLSVWIQIQFLHSELTMDRDVIIIWGCSPSPSLLRQPIAPERANCSVFWPMSVLPGKQRPSGRHTLENRPKVLEEYSINKYFILK